MKPVTVNLVTYSDTHALILPNRNLKQWLSRLPFTLPLWFHLVPYSIHLHRVPPDSSGVQYRARELPFDFGWPVGGGTHHASWRNGPASAGLQIVFPLSAPSHHPGCWLLPAHPPVHGEPGHHPHVCCCGDPVECLLHRWCAVRCFSNPARQSIHLVPAGSPTLPVVWLNHLSCRPRCCASCIWGNPYQWIVAHHSVWWIPAQRCRHCGEFHALLF